MNISLNVFLTNQLFILPNFRGCKWVLDTPERLLIWRAQPSLDISNVTKDGSTYDEQLHSSMQSFCEFITGVYMQKITCTRCNKTSKKEEPFSELMLQFPQSHHESDHTCTLNDLISHHNAPAESMIISAESVTCQQLQQKKGSLVNTQRSCALYYHVGNQMRLT